jgi:hypothetical protein
MFPESSFTGRSCMLRPSIALAVLSLCLPLALAAQDTAATPPAPEKRIRRDPSIISQEELAVEAGNSRDLLELVQRLRPFWIKPGRGPSSINLATSQPVVYVNNTRMGSPAVLRQYSATSIREIRHLRGTDASMRFGTDHENGAILVTLR